MSDISKINSNLPYSASNIQNTKVQASDEQFQKKLQHAMETKDDTELKKVSKDLEALFVNEMFKEMRKTITRSNLVESDTGRNIYESMLDEKLSEEISKGNGIGLADAIYKQLSNHI